MATQNKEIDKEIAPYMQSLHNADAENQSIVDQFSQNVDQYRAAMETPEQREKRIKQDKATAAMSGAIEGIGNIFNLVNTSANKGAVSVGGGAPVTQQVDGAITKAAQQRHEADEKLRAMTEKLNQLQMANAQQKAQNAEKMINIKSQLFYKDKDNARAEAEEYRKKQMHDEQLRGARAQADVTETTARNAQQKIDDEHNTAAAQRSHIGKQNEALDIQNEYGRMRNEAWKNDPELWKSHMSGSKMNGTSPANKLRNTIEFNPVINGQPMNLSAELDQYEVIDLIDKYPALKQRLDDEISKAEGVVTSGKNKGKKTRTISQKERYDIERAILTSALNDYDNNKDIIEDVLQRTGQNIPYSGMLDVNAVNAAPPAVGYRPIGASPQQVIPLPPTWEVAKK